MRFYVTGRTESGDPHDQPVRMSVRGCDDIHIGELLNALPQPRRQSPQDDDHSRGPMCGTDDLLES